ncbi:MAG: HYR domain-containing protein [Chitinophagales bacterium]|nr:HYR domain-containing protein [Chitinophagales bacterium]
MKTFNQNPGWLLAGLFLILCFSRTEANNEIDNIPPVAVCSDQLNVTLTSNGTALVLAQSFDEGSHDNYCLAGIAVKKTYDPYDDFGPWVVFDCNDIGQLVSVELRATDCSGNTNSCWVDVWVEDKTAPGIWCPYDKTVACDELLDWNAAGQATASDACGLANITHEDIDNTGSCGSGYITRIWKATDIYGNMSTCEQTIHVVDNTPVVVYFPPDYITYDCASEDDLLPDNLPAPYDRPQVLYEDCELIAESYEDWVFTASPNSCLKIIRQWKIIDWCSYSYGGNTGIWQETQILKIQDTIPPTFTCPDDVIVSTNYGSCLADVTLPMPTDIQDCLSEVDVSIHGDLAGATYHDNLQIGEYEVGYLLKDGCNNTSSCNITVTVIDGLPPGAVCIEGVSFSLMQNGEAMLWASDVEPGSSFDNCTTYEHLEFRLGPQPEPGQTTPPADDVMTFTCDDVGVNVVALWVGDSFGNWSYCLTTATVQDNQGVCNNSGAGAATIAGAITDEQGDRIPGVDIYTDSAAYWVFTDSTGLYSFGNMPMGEDYEITPQKEGDALEGLSLTDLIMLAKHLMGVDTLDSPYQIIAADVDRNGQLNNDDMLMLHELLLGTETELPDSVSWRFIPKDFVFPIAYPLSVNFPESIIINSLDQDVDDADFIGIKIGDLNASMMETDSSDFLAVEGRNTEGLGQITIRDYQLRAGEIVRIPIYLQTMGAAGLRATFNTNGLKILNVSTSSQGWLQAATNGFSWVANNKEYTTAPISYLNVQADRDILLSEALTLGASSRIAIQQEEGLLTENALTLTFIPQGEALSLTSVYPNPFKERVQFGFQQIEEGPISLSIWNAAGQLVYQKEQSLEAGSHYWEVAANELGGEGIYIYQLANKQAQAGGKLVLLNE